MIIKLKQTKKEQGFTLIEFLLYMVLLSILLMSLTDMFVSILESQTESTAISSVEQDGRFILARFSYDIARSTSISVPSNPGSSGDTLTLNINGVNNTYSLLNGNLRLSNNLGVNNLNGSGTRISAINFLKLGQLGQSDSVKITFTIESTAQRPSGPEIRNFELTVSRR